MLWSAGSAVARSMLPCTCGVLGVHLQCTGRVLGAFLAGPVVYWQCTWSVLAVYWAGSVLGCATMACAASVLGGCACGALGAYWQHAGSVFLAVRVVCCKCAWSAAVARWEFTGSAMGHADVNRALFFSFRLEAPPGKTKSTASENWSFANRQVLE